MTKKITYQEFFEKNDDCQDLFIFGLGDDIRDDEDMCMKLLHKYSKSNYKICFFNGENDYKKKFNSDIIMIDYSDEEKFYDGLRQINQLLVEFNRIINVRLNLAGLNREIIFQLLYILRYCKYVNISIEQFSCKYGNYNVSEYTEPQNLKFFEGSPKLSISTTMILLVGYEKEAAKILINYYQPKKLMLGFGIEPVEEGQEAPEKNILNELKQDYNTNPDMHIQEFDYYPAEPRKTFVQLEKVILQNIKENTNLLFATTSTKLSTVGAYLMCEKYPSIQVVFTNGLVQTNKVEELKMVHVYEIEEKNNENN